MEVFDTDEWETVVDPMPAHETPREMVKRMTGHDFDILEYLKWEHVREDPAIQKWLAHLINVLGKPQVKLQRKRNCL